jgi:protein SCO1
MLRNFLYITGIIALIFAFSCKQSSDTKTITDSAKSVDESLPYFNKPDWTPEWISNSDSAYKSIHTIPKFSFTNQEGNTITQDYVKGKIYVANFFFSRCRGICPKMATNMQLLQEAYKNDPDISLLSHSVTPEADSVSVLKKYAIDNNVDAKKWNLLTGDKSKIYSLAKREYFAGDSIGYYQTGNEFLHTENFILVDKQRRIRGVYNGTLLVEIERIKNDINTLKLEEEE